MFVQLALSFAGLSIIMFTCAHDANHLGPQVPGTKIKVAAPYCYDRRATYDSRAMTLTLHFGESIPQSIDAV